MSEDRCVVCGEIVPEGRQICWKCEHQSKDYHCIICGKKIPQPKLSFSGRGYGKSMMEFQYNMSQLCCSDKCWYEFAEEIRRELNEI